MSGCSSRSQASTTEAKASLISNRSIWSSLSPAFLSTRWVAGIGPVSMMVGSTPARAVATMRARGLSPRALARASDMISSAAAPSEICEELAAVTTPSGLNDGASAAIFSRFTGTRTPSSVSNTLPSASVSGAISRLKRPSAIARPARSWLWAANSSSSSRLMPHCSATISAESPCGMML